MKSSSHHAPFRARSSRKRKRSARNDLSERTLTSNPPEGRPGGRNVPDFRLVAVKFQGVDHNNFKGFHVKGKALTP
jgi:hypothetical protein